MSKQEIITELANIYSNLNENNFDSNTESKIQLLFGSLMKYGMTSKDIKEEIEEMIKCSW